MLKHSLNYLYDFSAIKQERCAACCSYIGGSSQENLMQTISPIGVVTPVANAVQTIGWPIAPPLPGCWYPRRDALHQQWFQASFRRAVAPMPGGLTHLLASRFHRPGEAPGPQREVKSPGQDRVSRLWR